MEPSYGHIFNLILIGNEKTGKTSLLSRFVNSSFTEKYQPTIGADFKFTVIKCQKNSPKLHIWDASGQKRFALLMRAYYPGMQGFIIVFDLTDKETFDAIDQYWEQVKCVPSNYTKTLLVGNKCDKANLRTVKFEEGMEKANKYGAPYIETSARTGLNVKEPFELIVKMLLGL